jgi:type IV pilus assembly protein PilA
MRIQDRLDKLRNKRGFTLVELMIVVAIIGVLAALAIYGVRKYLTNAKSAEARMAVGRMAKDAQLAYEKEDVAKGIIALTNTAAIAHKLCSTAAAVPLVAANIANLKYQSTPNDWVTPPITPGIAAGWTCLKFTMSDPQYFQYEYVLDVGDQTGVAPGAAGDKFTAHAHGDLDGDALLSDLSLEGQIQADGTSGELVLTLAATISENQVEE